MQKLQKQHNCIPDEHYVQTLLAVSIGFMFAFLFVLHRWLFMTYELPLLTKIMVSFFIPKLAKLRDCLLSYYVFFILYSVFSS